MLRLNLSQIAEITGGQLKTLENNTDPEIAQIVTDSRTWFKGERALFFALEGPRNDGHQYIPELIRKGIHAFVVSKISAVTPGAAFIVTDNTTRALQKLAGYVRSGYDFPILGITGSNGKTIVKEWLFELLSEDFSIVRNPKSFNSQVGVPLSVLLINENYNLGIFEAGISQPGEMVHLEKIIHPEIGILTNIGDAHQENFTTREQKLQEKLTLFKNSRILIYRSDNQKYNPIIEEFCRINQVKMLDWSTQNRQCSIFFEPHTNQNNTTITTTSGKGTFIFEIPFTDSSAIENACHCFAAVYALMNQPDKILPRFSKLSPVAMRLEIKKGINNCLLINDYYNSDLTSLAIALSVLNQQAQKGHLKKQIIISDIRQTGISQDKLYQQVNSLLEEWKIDEIIGIGSEIKANTEAFSMRKEFFLSVEEFTGSIPKHHFADSAILIKGAREFAFEKISWHLQQKAHQTVLEINMNALIHNMNVFRSLLKPSTKVMIMVKAFSYGSGDTEIAKLLQFHKADYLAVAVADEGVELRTSGIHIPIVVMNPELHSFQHIIDYHLEPNIYSMELLESFMTIAKQNALQDFPVHLKIDTGMNRLGFKSQDETIMAVHKILQKNILRINSVFSHLAASDDPSYDSFTRDQINKFEEISHRLAEIIPYKTDCHILNSAGTERFTDKQMDMVRLGIGIYGISQTGLPLEPVGTLKSTLSQVKTVSPDETVGYSRKGKVSQTSRIAIVPLGYADGIDRKLGNRNGSAYIKGKKVPVIGNVCMDMLMLDVTGLDVHPGDEVIFFGREISVEEVAAAAGTIPYEIFTGISQRVKRIYLQE